MKKSFKFAAFTLIAIFAISLAYAQAPLKKPKPSVKKEQTSKKSKGSSNSKSKTSSAKLSPADGTVNGYSYVDLGFPSGVKWATCNVGASKPEDYGKYFAWGETAEKNSYRRDNCSTYLKSMSWLRSNGYIDSSNNLMMEHDAAHQNMGDSWRMPTLIDIKELIDNTTSEWTAVNGVNGRLVQSKINGKTIFFPAAGWFDESKCKDCGSDGEYWSSTPDASTANSAYYFGCSSIFFDFSDRFRSHGHLVRGILE